MVDQRKIVSAFEWLKTFNYHFRDITIPAIDTLPIPRIIEDDL